MNIGEYINGILDEHGLKKNWVADRCNINYKSFCYKLKYDTFTASELLDVANVLNINLEDLKGELHVNNVK